jgi:hypothetical protein
VRKAQRWRAAGSKRSVPIAPLTKRAMVPDDSLVAHAPAVRAALARRG